MNTGDAASGGIRAITISREYGSGGGEIATRLARRLEWHLIDHEVVERVAQELGVSEGEAEEYDEHAEGVLARILHNLALVQPSVSGPIPVQLATDSLAYREARCHVIEAAIATGNVVIVGRGAQVLLQTRRDVLHVRVVAPLEQRIEYVMRREGLSHAAAQHRIQIKEHDRVRFLHAEHRQHPADAHLYDLVVNTAVLSLESVVDLLLFALERKAERLAVPATELGPAAGVPRYEESPADFQPPPSS